MAKKRCAKCGTVQDASRNTCVDCGAVLPSALSEKESERLEEELSDRLSDLSEHTDAFYIPLWAKILSILDGVILIATIVLLYFVPSTRTSRISPELILCLPFSVMSALALLCPKLFFKSRTWIYADVHVKPSDAFLISMKVIGVCLFAIAALMAAKLLVAAL